jgi:hypothetical protein
MPSHQCLTLKFVGKSPILHTPIAIAIPSIPPSPLPSHQIRCIWDTGCSVTTITQNVVDSLGLKQTGISYVNTASETNKKTKTFEVDLFINAELIFRNLTVNLGVIFSGIDCLLGMDIIGTGDLSVTSLNGNTCMSFRHPSSHEIDFYRNPKFGILENKLHLNTPTSLNAPCPCGSSKQYKRCCGKSK